MRGMLLFDPLLAHDFPLMRTTDIQKPTVFCRIHWTVAAVGLNPVRMAFRSPWQNGVAERWVGSCRRDLLDHVIPVDERHLKRLLTEYVGYYQEDRTHLGLSKELRVAVRPQFEPSAREFFPDHAWADCVRPSSVLAN